MFTNEPAELFFPPLGGPNEDELKDAHTIIEKAHEAIRAQKANTMFKCAKCGEVTPIAQMKYIQTFWYTKPFGCTGGDYSTPGEGMIPCAKCGIEHRTEFSPGLEDLKEFFGTKGTRDR